MLEYRKSIHSGLEDGFTFESMKKKKLHGAPFVILVQSINDDNENCIFGAYVSNELVTDSIFILHIDEL